MIFCAASGMQNELMTALRATSAWLAVGNPLEARPEQRTRGGKHVLSRVQRDAADEVHMRRHVMTSLKTAMVKFTTSIRTMHLANGRYAPDE